MTRQVHSPPTLIHIEDDLFCADALRKIIGLWPEVKHMGLATTVARGLELCYECLPDLVLLDVGLPDGSGFEAISALTTAPKSPRILLLTGVATEATLFRFMRAGVAGIIWKGAFAPEVLREAIANVVAGKTYLSPETQQALLSFRRDPNAFFKILSERELELLPLFGRGDSDAEIAAQVKVEPLTVKSHLMHIAAKLGLHGRAGLIRWCAERGFQDFVHRTGCQFLRR